MKQELTNIADAVRDGDDELTVKLVNEALGKNMDATEVLEMGLVVGVQALGALFKDGQAYLPEVLISVRAMNRGLDILQPHLKGDSTDKKGTVVLGTVEGDVHDIGKNLVGMMLKSNGYKVIDIGVDAPAEVFVEAVKENNANIVAMSALLTTTIPYYSVVIQALQEAGVRDQVRVLVGGAASSREYADEVGAEGFAIDCVSAVDEAARLMSL